MSRQNVEAVRRAIEVFNRDGPEAATAFIDPEIEWHDLAEQPDASVHYGREGFIEAVEQFAGGFEDFRVFIDEIFDHGDQVIVYNRTVGRGRGSGGFVEMRYATVAQTEGRLVQRLTLYSDIDETRAAAERLAKERG